MPGNITLQLRKLVALIFCVIVIFSGLFVHDREKVTLVRSRSPLTIESKALDIIIAPSAKLHEAANGAAGVSQLSTALISYKTCTVSLAIPARPSWSHVAVSQEVTQTCLRALEPLLPHLPYRGNQGCLNQPITLALNKKVKHPRFSAGMRWAGSIDRSEIARRAAALIPLEKFCPAVAAARRVLILATRRQADLAADLRAFMQADQRSNLFPFGGHKPSQIIAYVALPLSVSPLVIDNTTLTRTNFLANFAKDIRKDVKEEDRVVLAMADSNGHEVSFIESLFAEGVIHLVDEVFVHCVNREWNFDYKGTQTGIECLKFMVALRRAKVYAHQWF